MPIALRMCMEVAALIRDEFPGRSLSGIGGIESGRDAAQFILLGCDTVQVCTYVMKVGYRCVRPMLDELSAFMDQHGFRTLADFKGHSLQYFTTHYDLVQRQAEARKTAKAAAARTTANRSRPTTNGAATISCSRPMHWRGAKGGRGRSCP